MKSDLVFPFESAAWPALLLDAKGGICRANAAAVTLFDSALDGPSAVLSQIWSPQNNATVEQFLKKAESSPSAAVPLKFIRQGRDSISCLASLCGFGDNGQKYYILQLLPAPSGIASEAKSQSGEPGLAHKQKLECALQLARTVALDFNNALTSILGHTSLVLSKMESGHPWRPSLLEVEKSAAKAAEIANDLGTFSRQEKEARGQTAGNLNQLLQRAVEFFQQNAGTSPIQWKLGLERNPFAARFDEAKMQQAFMKILENSQQAITGYGQITVQTRNVELAERSQDRNVQLAAGAYVCVEINDSGCGIPSDVLPRIFEPFFTTKGGPHRGLGLAWVYGIVTNHGGGVAVSSEVGSGTSVRVYLPAEKKIIQEPTGLTAQDLSGTQTILFVDDEDLLLTMGQAILSAYGYRVLTANSGQKALETLGGKDAVDLVITDLVMPTMSGRELIEHIHNQWPNMRILCISGYVWPAGQEDQATYLQKPFTSQGLLLKVKQVLNS